MRDNEFEDRRHQEKPVQSNPKPYHPTKLVTPKKSGLRFEVEKCFKEVTKIVNEYPKRFTIQDGYRFAIFDGEKQLCAWRETNEEWEAIQGGKGLLATYKATIQSGKPSYQVCI